MKPSESLSVAAVHVHKPEAVMSERRVAILGGLLAGLGPISLSLFTPAMPALAEAFSASDRAAKATLSAYFAGFAVAQLFAGPLSDRYGRKPVTQAFLLVYLLGSLGALFAPDIATMIWSRLVQGVGAAAGVVVARAIVRDLFTGEASSRVLNISSIVLGAGPAIGPAIGGGAMMLAGWQAPFVMMVLLGVVSLAIVQAMLLETRPSDKRRTVSLVGLVRGYLAVARDQRFLWSSMTIACAIATFYAQSTALSFVFMGRLGYTPGEFGLVMLVISGGFVLGAVSVRLLLPRYGAFSLVPFGVALLLASALALAALFAVAGPSLVTITIPVTLMIAANAFILPAMYTASLAPFADSAGTASSLSGFLTMAVGLVGSIWISLFADPAVALPVVDVAMAALAALCFLKWRRLTAGPYWPQ